MTLKTTMVSAAWLSLAMFGTAASAQTVLSGNHSVDGRLCAGQDCTGSESFGAEALKLKSPTPFLKLDDTSPSSSPDRDWSLLASGSATEEIFAIQDVTASSIPFKIVGDAEDNAFFLARDGDVGLGTSLPQQKLHIVSVNTPSIRFENISGNGWDINAASSEFNIRNLTNNTVPLILSSAAPTSSIIVNRDGNIGLGTISPEAPLHLLRPDAFNFFRITAEGAAVNKSVDITFTGGPLGTGQLRYNIVDGDAQEMSLDANGNVVIDGTLTTAGPTCASGCDRVFEADYALPSIADHAAQMYARGYLPSVGPTQTGQPVNLTEQMGGMLNALEHAHIYINQQDGEIERLTARLQQMEEVQTQLLTHLSLNLPSK